MCTFKDARTVEVCDVAIEYVKQAVDAAFPGKARYSRVDGEPTRVEAQSDVDSEAFAAHVRSGIDAASSTTA